MLFNKYQYNNVFVQKRGFSHSCIATDEQRNKLIVKWLFGVEKNSTKSKILGKEGKTRFLAEGMFLLRKKLNFCGIYGGFRQMLMKQR